MLLEERLERLRDEWGMQAWGIELTMGDDCPAAKAIRHCISDLFRAIREGQNEGTTEREAATK